MKKTVQAGWSGWRKMSGVICDRRVPPGVERNVYNVAVRLAMFTVLAEVTKEHADDITEWKRNIRCDDS